MFVLVVTWFYYGQPPAGSQSDFSSVERCKLAKQMILSEAQRLKDTAIADAAPRQLSGGSVVLSPNPIYPTVSAICAQR
jgi:hypothetical protein